MQQDVYASCNRLIILAMFGVFSVTKELHITMLIEVCNAQGLKCNGTQGNTVPPPPIYMLKAFPHLSYARERHTTIVRGPNLYVAFPHL